MVLLTKYTFEFSKEDYEQDILVLKEKHENETKSLKENYESKINGLEEKIANLVSDSSKQKADYENKIGLLNSQIDDAIEQKTLAIKEANKTVSENNKARALAMAQLDAIRVANGLITPSEEYASKEKFNELFAEYELLENFLIEQWKITKKEIRNRILNSKMNEEFNTKKKKEKKNKVSEEITEESKEEDKEGE